MVRRKLLIASRNHGKINEIKHKLADLPFEIVSLDEIETDEALKTIDENAYTFEGNAIIKAMIFGHRFNLLTLGDDSGLEVEALDGRPGVQTARYPGDTAIEKYLNLLEEMKDVPDDRRQAKFVGAIAIYDPKTETVHTCSAELNGIITREPKGDQGFGYDPIMFLPEYGKTVAEISMEEKSKIDHRGQALEKAKEILKKYY